MRAARRLKIAGWLIRVGWSLLFFMIGTLAGDLVWVDLGRGAAMWLTLSLVLAPGGCFVAAMWLDSKIPVLFDGLDENRRPEDLR